MRRIALPVALLTLVSCGGENGGGSTPTQPVTPVATTIEVSSASITLESLGATSTLTATVKDQTGAAMTGQTVSWASSDDAIATVSNGTVTAVANGSATVTATSGSLNASASVTVSQMAVSVAITPSALSFASLTDTVSVAGQIADALGNPMDGGSDPITWTTSDTTVASVSAEGLVTSVGNGSSSITATSGALTGSADVTVEQIAASLTLSEDSVTFRSISDSLIVSVGGADALGSSMDSVAVAWTTSDVGVATVTDGLVRPIANGTASITATAGDVTATLSVVVGIEYFYLAENGVTVMCPDAADGDTGVVNGITYTKWSSASASTTCTSGITDLSFRFFQEVTFNEDISSWDVSSVTDMTAMFEAAESFNQDISSWNVSSVATMAVMFGGASSFNQNISSWDVSSVTDMRLMFTNASAFDQPLGEWDVSSVTNMSSMFDNAGAFNQDLSAWDVSSVSDMSRMFQLNPAFNGGLSGWDVSSVTDMSYMFLQASSFDQDISSWNVARVENMHGMFDGATAFNQPIGSWDVSAVTDMNFMFATAQAFNQPIGSWDVSSVGGMGDMFTSNDSFDQDLSGWCVAQLSTLPGGFDVDATAWTLPRPVWGTCSPASTVQTTVTANPEILNPDGVSTSTITVQLRDVSGALLTQSLGDLTFDAPSLGSIGTVLDNGDGSYNVTYTAGASEGTDTLVASIDAGLKAFQPGEVILRFPTYLTVRVLGDGEPVEGVDVFLAKPDDSFVKDTTDVSGEAVFTNLESGIHTVTLQPLPNGFSVTNPQQVDMVMGQAQDLTFDGVFAPGQVSVTVSSWNEPLAGATVRLAGKDTVVASTNGSGRIEAKSLQPGIYNVTVDPYSGVNFRDERHEVQVLSGQVVDVAFLGKPDPAPSWSSVSAGANHACGVTESGDAYCWGANATGALGIGSLASSLWPARVSGAISFQEVAVSNAGRSDASFVYSCGLSDASVYCWGDNSYGQLGDGSLINRVTPAEVTGLPPVQRVVVGLYHACALDASGAVWCWGSNENGELGPQAVDLSRSPLLVPLASPAVDIAAGPTHTCAVLDTEAAQCWGSNDFGQLGRSVATAESQSSPADVAGSIRFSRVVAGGWFDSASNVAYGRTCALSSFGEVWCWGYQNEIGQLGNGSTSPSVEPALASGGNSYQSVAAGIGGTCALSFQESWCWGHFLYDSTYRSNIPIRLSDWPSLSVVSTGGGDPLPYASVCAVTADRALICSSELFPGTDEYGGSSGAWVRVGGTW